MSIYSPEFVDAFDKSGNALPIAGPNPLVMRILCPALIKPEMLGFRLHPRDSLPVGIQIGRFLQHPGQTYLLYETTDINQFPNQTVSFSWTVYVPSISKQRARGKVRNLEQRCPTR